MVAEFLPVAELGGTSRELLWPELCTSASGSLVRSWCRRSTRDPEPPRHHSGLLAAKMEKPVPDRAMGMLLLPVSAGPSSAVTALLPRRQWCFFKGTCSSHFIS